MEIGQLMMERDFTPVFESNEDWTNTPSRAKFENLINMVYGQATPDKNLKFIVYTTDDKFFFVYYLKDYDKFLYEKLAKR
jgi:hypothetical protein